MREIEVKLHMEWLLEMLKWIQSIRTPGFSQVFTLITILGEEYFAIIILCIILWCVNSKAGYKIGFAYLTSYLFNHSLKQLFQVPRPFVLDQGITPLRPETATGFSFPSGHTQSITALATSLMLAFRRKWLSAAGTVLVILVAMSRLYLGVHTLLDVIGGALFGIAWVFIANAVFNYAESRNRQSFILLLYVPLLLGFVFIQTSDYYKTAGIFSSFIVGYLLDSRYFHFETRSRPWQQVAKFSIGIAGLLAIKETGKIILGESLTSEYLRYFCVGIWVTVLAPWFFKQLFSHKNPDSHQLADSVPDH